MKKNLLIAALALTALAGCTSDEYVGDTSPGTAQGNHVAINFSGDAGKMTRATSNTGTVAQMLDGQMKIFGVKVNTAEDPDVYTTVFDNYMLWTSTSNATTSNPDATTNVAAENGWEYVGAAGTYGTVTLSTAQNIKYWDWGTNEYHFVAGSPVANFTYTITDGEIASASVTGINGHINPNTSTALSKDPVYIAAPVKKVNGTDYNTDVVFQFTRQQTYVRVGVYETIPGYKITSIDFYEWDKNKEGGAGWKGSPQNAHNIVLNSKTASYFKGTSSSSASVTVTYNWTTTPASISAISYGTAPVEQESWYGGKLDLSATNPLATSAAEATTTYFYGTDSDIDAKGYFTVLPTPSGTAGQPIIIKCDYQLTALDGTETINVKGATAAIPAAFTKWNPNTSYTYLFKISDNTNGTTGTVGTSPEGLFPITFDATVIAELDANKQGYITTVSTPSITTYQEGSVVDTDDPAAHGIKYTTGSAIYFTAQDDETGELNTLTALSETPAVGMVQVYSVTAGSTEADLILTRPTTTVSTTVGNAAWTINGQSVESGKWASFTPTAAGTYAIEYVTSASPSYAYKVVVVE